MDSLNTQYKTKMILKETKMKSKWILISYWFLGKQHVMLLFIIKNVKYKVEYKIKMTL